MYIGGGDELQPSFESLNILPQPDDAEGEEKKWSSSAKWFKYDFVIDSKDIINKNVFAIYFWGS